MEIKYSKTAAKYIEHLDKPTKDRIRKGIEGLTECPPKGNIKPLKGYAGEYLRLRIGKYRIIYAYILNDLCIVDVDSRGDIYK